MVTVVTGLEGDLPWERKGAGAYRRVPHLVLAWSLDEPERVGEAFSIDGPTSLGRGAQAKDDPAPRALPLMMRPGDSEARAPIRNGRISRLHLVLTPSGDDALRVKSVGRAVMRVNGRATVDEEVTAGDVIEIHNAAVFLVTARPLVYPRVDGAASGFGFGMPDPFGIVGESEVAWALRGALAFAASTDKHVLLLGESGAGKELAARCIHGLSARRTHTLIARNAATLPESLLDAELFGNVKNYPNPGMADRPGLIGESDQSTMFLDEIGDLPESHQVHLLRVLDSDGEYQRLGEGTMRRSSFRLIAATNRPLDSLKHDFLARFTHRIQLPGLGERRDDIPLVLASLLRRVAATNAAIAGKFFERRGGAVAEARIAPELIVRLLRHNFTHHVRELERLIWLAIESAPSDYLGVTREVEAELEDSLTSADSASAVTATIDRETLVKALAEHGRSPSRVARALGLKNRYVLIRLLKKYGLSAGTDEGAGT